MGRYVCGVDEVGRGALAGPVCVAAVVIPEHASLPLLNDSKQVSQKQRCLLAKIIKQRYSYSIGWVMPKTIDNINILQATLQAMTLAVDRLSQESKTKIDIVLIDGNQAPILAFPTQTIVKGDTKEPSIMMASIIAKEARDEYMRSMALFYPNYGFERHVGYPTKAHKVAITTYGLSPIHRKTFKIK